MGKRFTDTDLWDKEWFMDLAPAEKCAWYYIKDRCDNVGVWSPNRKLANVVIGADVDWEDLPEKCHGNIKVLPSGKWLIVDFVRFQHPDVFADYTDRQPSNAVKSYLTLLVQHKLQDEYPELAAAFAWVSQALLKTLPSPSQDPPGASQGASRSPQGKEQERNRLGTGKEQEKEAEIEKRFLEIHRPICQRCGKPYVGDFCRACKWAPGDPIDEEAQVEF